MPEALTDAMFKRKAKPTKNEKDMFIESAPEVTIFSSNDSTLCRVVAW